MLSYPFMQYALLAALMTGMTTPAIGTYLVQRRLALLGDGIGHIALTGVALGVLTHTTPIITAVIVSSIGAIAIELLRAYGHTSGDVALALLFYGGIAGGVLLINLAGGTATQLNGYLFGAITTISSTDLILVFVLAVVILVIALGLAPQLFAVCQDEEHARVSGVPVRLYSIVIAVLAAVTVTVAMRTVGLLLVSALMVVPVATAQQLTRSFKTTVALAMAIGTVAAVMGVTMSYFVDTQPGPTIVVLALGVFVLVTPIGTMLRSRRNRRAAAHPESRLPA